MLPNGILVTTLGSGKEDTGWGVGFETSDKMKWIKAGFGYWYLEANAFPSMYTDSDLLDGVTNRKGWAVYISRQIFRNTDLNFSAFVSEPIQTDVPPFGASVPASKRVRTMLDVAMKF